MIDTGFVVTMIVIVVGCSLLLRIAPPIGGDRERIYDLAIGPLFIGIIVARLVAMAFDDLGRALRLRDVLLLRSGMEFWTGRSTRLCLLALAEGPFAALGPTGGSGPLRPLDRRAV